MNNEYDDIINLPHHVSQKHPRMPLAARAAQFAPFAALTGYNDEIDKSTRQVTESFNVEWTNDYDDMPDETDNI